MENKIKILYIDDKIENIEAAKTAFSEFEEVVLDTYQTIEEGKQAIDKSFEENKRYIIGLFDLQMPDENGNIAEIGTEIFKYALEKGIFSFMCTEKDAYLGHGHKSPGTRLVNSIWDDKILGKKNEIDTWKKIYDSLFKTQDKEKSFDAIKRNIEFGSVTDLSDVLYVDHI